MLFLTARRFISNNKRYLPSYTILKVRRQSTPQEIKESFLNLSKIYHPDNVKTGNHNRFLRIKTAYDQIKDAPLSNINDSLNDENCDLTHEAHIKYREKTGTHIVNPRNIDIYDNHPFRIKGIFSKLKKMF